MHSQEISSTEIVASLLFGHMSHSFSASNGHDIWAIAPSVRCCLPHCKQARPMVVRQVLTHMQDCSQPSSRPERCKERASGTGKKHHGCSNVITKVSRQVYHIINGLNRFNAPRSRTQGRFSIALSELRELFKRQNRIRRPSWEMLTALLTMAAYCVTVLLIPFVF
jgi:hypothetical protein